MIKEDYVSFEIAKLLKENGFEQNTNLLPYYTDNGNLFTGDINTSHIRYYNAASAPTLQMVMKWMREVHNLHICIFIGEDYSKDADGNIVDRWQFWTYNITNIWGDMVYDAYDKFDCTEYQSYEEAYNDAIKYCLENLI